jgi:hypothetical protein
MARARLGPHIATWIKITFGRMLLNGRSLAGCEIDAPPCVFFELAAPISTWTGSCRPPRSIRARSIARANRGSLPPDDLRSGRTQHLDSMQMSARWTGMTSPGRSRTPCDFLLSTKTISNCLACFPAWSTSNSTSRLTSGSVRTTSWSRPTAFLRTFCLRLAPWESDLRSPCGLARRVTLATMAPANRALQRTALARRR